MIIGTNMPGAAGHHSSMTKSLYAWTHRSASSLSLDVQEQRAGEAREGREHTLAAHAVASMSLARSTGS